MMPSPTECRFLESHEWARRDGDLVTVGVSEFAVDQLQREIVFVEMPEVGRVLAKGEVFGVIEAVKAASDLYCPMGGTVVEVNAGLSGDPSPVGTDPFGGGWLVKLEPNDWSEWQTLMEADAYDRMCEAGGGH